MTVSGSYFVDRNGICEHRPATRSRVMAAMTDDDEPSDGRRMSFGSRPRPQALSRSRLSQTQSLHKASPLLSFSKSLQDARKNADALVVSAQNNEHVRKFKDNLEEFESKLKLQAQEATAKFNSMKRPQDGVIMQERHFPPRLGPANSMRKSYSASDFSKFSQASTLAVHLHSWVFSN